MALRLPGSTHTDEPVHIDPETVTSGLVARAGAALTAGDFGGFEQILAEASGLPEPQHRYRTELLVLEQGLLYARSASDSAAVRSFVAVADGALTILDREPSEPVLLLYAGVACYELWALDGARALFGAAARLDPSLPDLARNRDQLAQRLRGRRPSRPLHGAVPGLVRRARGISGRARAATGLTISLCMIVKDEEQMLPRCLEAVRPAVDEIIVVDTGSTDATMEIARSFGARVIERPWTGSFAEPRNVSFDAATSDWIIYLDADEVLVADDVERLRELTGQTWREAFHLIETSFVGELGDGAAIVNTALRVFRNRPQYRFAGTIHEQIYKTLPSDAPGRVGHSSVRIEHYGYLEDTRAVKDKSTRNLSLLLEERDSGAPATPFLHFNLGCEYAAAGEAPKAIAELTSAWDLIVAGGEVHSTFYTPSLLSTLIRALRLSGQARPGDLVRRDGPWVLPRLYRPSAGAGRGPPGTRRDRGGPAASRALHRAGRCPGELRRPGRQRYLSAAPRACQAGARPWRRRRGGHSPRLVDHAPPRLSRCRRAVRRGPPPPGRVPEGDPVRVGDPA